jgi:hypothetical protein
MAMRVSPGPLFIYESLILARRRQVYAGRTLFVLAVFLGLAMSWWSTDILSSPSTTAGAASTFKALASAGESFFYNLAGIQLAMVLLAAPAPSATTARAGSSPSSP